MLMSSSTTPGGCHNVTHLFITLIHWQFQKTSCMELGSFSLMGFQRVSDIAHGWGKAQLCYNLLLIASIIQSLSTKAISSEQKGIMCLRTHCAYVLISTKSMQIGTILNHCMAKMHDIKPICYQVLLTVPSSGYLIEQKQTVP
jgi:hypothetical protein